jgi:hypothetical protein
MWKVWKDGLLALLPQTESLHPDGCQMGGRLLNAL